MNDEKYDRLNKDLDALRIAYDKEIERVRLLGYKVEELRKYRELRQERRFIKMINENDFDIDEAVKFIETETGLNKNTVEKVLMSELRFMKNIGIIEGDI